MPFVKDPVRNADRQEVYARDGGCVAPLLDPNAGPCRNRWGQIVSRDETRFTRTLDHVPPKPGAPRISRPRWMVQVCWGHGVHSGWATSHRTEERDHLASKYPEEP